MTRRKEEERGGSWMMVHGKVGETCQHLHHTHIYIHTSTERHQAYVSVRPRCMCPCVIIIIISLPPSYLLGGRRSFRPFLRWRCCCYVLCSSHTPPPGKQDRPVSSSPSPICLSSFLSRGAAHLFSLPSVCVGVCVCVCNILRHSG